MPQVAADYRINTYFRDPRGIYVNLYIPSALRWTQDGAQVSLTQKTTYPFDSLIQFELTTSRPQEFAVNFRIPAWAEGASITVNGKRVREAVVPGSFATVQRLWKGDDQIELELPLTKRLEPIDAGHPKAVALMCGPLVLFAITEAQPAVTSKQLLSAKKVGAQNWQVETAAVPMTMLPFTAVADEQYSTYVLLT